MKTLVPLWAGHHHEAFNSSTEHLSFFTMTNGLIRLGLEWRSVGGHVVLFHGTNDTMLLRSSAYCYTYGGLVYVRGLSDGEMDDLPEAGEFEDRSFTLQ
jgi:hypothetical protein